MFPIGADVRTCESLEADRLACISRKTPAKTKLQSVITIVTEYEYRAMYELNTVLS